MKKILSLSFLAFLLFLAGCSQVEDYVNTQQIKLNANQSLAFSTYLASGMLSSEGTTTENMSNNLYDYNVEYLTSSDAEATASQETSAATEAELREYFDRLKFFIDNGLTSMLTLQEEASTIEGYDKQVSYTIDGVVYTIHYSIVDSLEEADTEETIDEVDTEDQENEADIEEDEEDEDEEDKEKDLDDEEEYQLRGLMIIDGVQYELVGGNEIEENENKLWFETKDNDDSDNYVSVEIKQEDGEQKFEFESMIDGVEKSSELKFEMDGEETKVELELEGPDGEKEFEFKRELEGGEPNYKLEYAIGDTEGEVYIVEVVDANGNVTYDFVSEDEFEEDDDDEDEYEEEDEEESEDDDDHEDDEEEEEETEEEGNEI